VSIHRLARRRPSPALIVACLALFVALGGTSYAVAVGSIGSPQIRDGSVRSVDVRDNGLRGKDLARDTVDGEAIAEETLDVSKLDLPRSEPPTTVEGTLLQVRVEMNGRYSLARGVEDVEHLGAGSYHVIFDRDVSSCVPATTVYPEMPGSGVLMVRPSDETPRAFQVYVSGGDGIPHDLGFYLLVSC
jgi:hypothetical protein